MKKPTVPRWVWEQTDPRVSGSSGDISKLFRNEVVKHPGVFAFGAPSDAATLLVREVFQNSVDAAVELQDEVGEGAPDLEIDLVFESLTKADKKSLVDRLDLKSLAVRASTSDAPAFRAKLGLSAHDCLETIASSTPLQVLKIIERGTTGMYGPFVGAKSKMYLALISLGYTAKSVGSGGSYGYGKAGLIRASTIRAVVAYTRFRERPDDPGVTRRLLGMTYWGQHDIGEASFTGFARFGDDVDGAILPFENEAADAVAASLGIAVRTHNDDDLGTTFLLIDPSVEPRDVVTAIERNWWPAIEDGRLAATVFADGHEFVPRPRRDPVLQSFIEAYDLALSEPDNVVPTKKRSKLTPFDAPNGRRYDLGTLGLVAEPGGWTYAASDPEEDGEPNHRSLVALLRGPRMIVEYLEAGASRPYVRGAFVADSGIDDLLRQTEPKAHDGWQTRVDEGGVDEVAPEIAGAILKRVRNHVDLFRKILKPPPRPAEDIRLPELEKLFQRLLQPKGNESTPPPSGERPFSISVKATVVEDQRPMHLRVEGTVRYALSASTETNEPVEADLTLSYRYVEDRGTGEEAVLHVTPPAGFEPVGERPYRFRGLLSHDHVEFKLVSEPYPSDWTGKLKTDAAFSSDSSAAASISDEDRP